MTDPNNNPELKAKAKELLPLTGIFGLYKTPKKGKDISQLDYFPNPPYHEGTVLFKIRCKELREYWIKINPTQKTIKNSLVIGHDDYKGAYLAIFNSQVKYAKLNGFKEIYLDAWYQDEPFEYKVDDNVIDLVNWNGHEIWGKYGFVMSDEEREEVFLPSMISNQKTEDFIHEIHLETESANEAKQIWAGLKLHWEGVFDLRDNSLSHQLLQGLNGKYAKYPKYAKTL